MNLRALPAAVLYVLLTGCGGGTADGAPDTDALPILSLTEELRVGSLDDPDLGFATIGGVAVGPDGLAYVLERQAREVRVYDDRGNRVRTIGRGGEGPGEFDRPFYLGFLGDTLWVNDGGSRVTMFDTEGEVLSTLQVPSVTIDLGGGVMGFLQAGVMRNDGRMHATQGLAVMAGPGGGGTRSDSILIPEVLFDRNGKVVDTVGFTTRRLTSGPRVRLSGRDVSAPTAPSDDALRVLDPGGVLNVERTAAESPGEAMFTVTRTGLTGDTVYRRSFGYTPQGFEPEFVDTLIARRVQSYARVLDEDPANMERTFRSAMEIPPFQTPVTTAIVGVDGSAWLRREDDGGPTFWWVVLDPEGDPVGRFELPRSVSILWARIGMVYGSATDDFDIPWLVRYRVGPVDG